MRLSRLNAWEFELEFTDSLSYDTVTLTPLLRIETALELPYAVADQAEEAKTLYDQNALALSLLSVDKGVTTSTAARLNFLVENNSDTAYKIDTESMILDGFMAEKCYFHMPENYLLPYKKAYAYINIDRDELDRLSIVQPQVAELCLSIENQQNLTERTLSPLFLIPLDGQLFGDGSNPSFNQAPVTVIDHSDIVVTVRPVDDYGEHYNTMHFEVVIENNSGWQIGVNARDAYINDQSMSLYLFTPTILPGKKSIGTIAVSTDGLKKAGIESINQIRMRFIVVDENLNKLIHTSKEFRWEFDAS